MDRFLHASGLVRTTLKTTILKLEQARTEVALKWIRRESGVEHTSYPKKRHLKKLHQDLNHGPLRFMVDVLA